MATLGIISDTHGLLRPEALRLLQGADHIVHGGDIGGEEILTRLGQIAPLTTVRGNNDTAAWAQRLPLTACFEFAGIRIYAIHDLAGLAIDPLAAGVQVVVSGHSHQPRIERRDGVWFVNPGSAGPRRFRLPISLAEIQVRDGKFEPRLLDIGPATAA